MALNLFVELCVVCGVCDGVVVRMGIMAQKDAHPRLVVVPPPSFSPYYSNNTYRWVAKNCMNCSGV
jgi:hypothetical protein